MWQSIPDYYTDTAYSSYCKICLMHSSTYVRSMYVRSAYMRSTYVCSMYVRSVYMRSTYRVVCTCIVS